MDFLKIAYIKKRGQKNGKYKEVTVKVQENRSEEL